MEKDPEYTFAIPISDKLKSMPLSELCYEAQIILNEVRDIAPVRTGNLRRSIHIDPYAFANGFVEMYVDTEYFTGKPPYYRYTNTNVIKGKPVSCFGWWEKMCNRFKRRWSARAPIVEKKTQRLSEKAVKELDTNLIAALVGASVGAKVDDSPDEKKRLIKLRDDNRDKFVNGLALYVLIRILIEKLNEQSKARRRDK